MEFRDLRWDDLPQLPGLIAALDREPIPWDRFWLERKIFGDQDFAPHLSPVAVVSEQVVALVHGVIRNQGEIAYLKLMAVEQAFRRRGTATHLLDLFEERAAVAGATRVQLRFGAPTYLLPGLDPGYTSALTLLLRRGYQTDQRSICNMDVDLQEERLNTHADEERLRKLGYDVRRAVRVDIEETTDLAYRLGGDAWRGEVAQAFDFAPIRLHVAASRQGIVAFAVQDVVGPGLFGPTGTDPVHRRLGIGTVLLKRCLRDVLVQGRTQAEICAVGPIPFYAHAVGAKVGRMFWTLEKAL